MNGPFTMNPEMSADAARAFQPKSLYTDRSGSTDAAALVRPLRDDSVIEVRIGEMQ